MTGYRQQEPRISLITCPDLVDHYIPRQLTPEEIEALRQDMRCQHIDNMKVLETMDLSHLEQEVPTQR